MHQILGSIIFLSWYAKVIDQINENKNAVVIKVQKTEKWIWLIVSKVAPLGFGIVAALVIIRCIYGFYTKTCLFYLKFGQVVKIKQTRRS